MDRYGCKMRNQWTKTQYNVYIYIIIIIIIIIINYYLLLLLLIIIITIIIIIYYYYYIIYNRIYVYYVYMYNKLVSCIKPALSWGYPPILGRTHVAFRALAGHFSDPIHLAIDPP